MATETIAANKLMHSIIIGGSKEMAAKFTDILKTDGSDIKAGDIVATSTTDQNDIDLIAAGEIPRGIVLDYAYEAEKKASYSLGVTIPDNKLVKVLRIPSAGDIIVQCVLNRSATVSALVEINQPIYSTSTDAGKVSSVAPTTVGLDVKTYIGRSMDNVAVSVTADKVIRVRLG